MRTPRSHTRPARIRRQSRSQLFRVSVGGSKVYWKNRIKTSPFSDTEVSMRGWDSSPHPSPRNLCEGVFLVRTSRRGSSRVVLSIRYCQVLGLSLAFDRRATSGNGHFRFCTQVRG